jgi:hypothetical protein
VFPLPRIVFVLGKGGVGRTTLSAATALARAEGGERVLVFEWTVAEPIGPWFGSEPAGMPPREVAPGLSVGSYDLHEALREYFVDHLHAGVLYRRVIDGRHVRRLVDAAPGIAELLFLGTLWWLTTLAEREAGLRFDRIIVDVPATGHGASLLDFPATLSTLGATGLLGLEVSRVRRMLADPSWTGAFVVAVPEELAVEETAELLPRATRALGRAPLLLLVNRSVAGAVGDGARPAWLDDVAGPLSPPSRAALETMHAELRARVRFEAELRARLHGATTYGVVAIDDRTPAAREETARDVVRGVSAQLLDRLRGTP